MSSNALGKKAGHDRHRGEFLEEELACVWHEDLHNLHLLLRGRTPETSLVQIRDREESTFSAHVCPECVAVLECPVLQESRGTVRYYAVPVKVFFFPTNIISHTHNK